MKTKRQKTQQQQQHQKHKLSRFSFKVCVRFLLHWSFRVLFFFVGLHRNAFKCNFVLQISKKMN